MANKKRRLNNVKSHNQKSNLNKGRTQPQKTKPQQKQQQQQAPERPTIPFDPTDRIVLIGEGDLSFAASLVRHHGCSNLVATVLEKSQAELVEKYPQAAANIETILNPPPQLQSPKPDTEGLNKVKEDDDDDGDEEDYDDEDEGDDNNSSKKSPATEAPVTFNNKVLYGIDATKPLPASVSRPPPRRIIFNFPHVGGKSTDVNRQVRHNQSLLVSFFTRAVLPTLAPRGTLIVTLFEAEPYTLWNIRDLARHAGLQNDRSFRFPWSSYPGYHHARTLGVIKSRDGAPGAGWRGEDRPARSYVFARQHMTPIQPKGITAEGQGKKRKVEDSDDDDGDDDY